MKRFILEMILAYMNATCISMTSPHMLGLVLFKGYYDLRALNLSMHTHLYIHI